MGSQAAPVRVLFLIDSLGAGGAERQAELLLTHLPKDRVTVRLGCIEGDRSRLGRIAAAGVPIEKVPGVPRRIWPIRALLRLRSSIRRHRVQVVQTFLPTFDILGPLLRPLAPGIRIVTSRRNVDEQLHAGRLRMVRWTGRWADAIVANSEAVAASVRRLEGQSRSRLLVIPNGIEPVPPIDRVERDEARRRLGLEPWEYVVAYVAHFRDGKGYDHLPRLIRDLVDRVPRARIAIAGEMERSRVYLRTATGFRKAIKNLGLEDRVLLLGRVDGSRAVLAASDVALNLSDLEGMSNTLMESMALGLPTVATDAGGAREMIEDGVDGYVVRRGDVGVAVKCLAHLAGDADLRMRLGAVAREKMLEEFSASRMAGRYADLYEEVAAGVRSC